MAEKPKRTAAPAKPSRAKPPAAKPSSRKTTKTPKKKSVETDTMSALFGELEQLKKATEQVGARIQAQMIGRIDGVIARMKEMEPKGKTRRKAKKMRNKIKSLKLKPAKGRVKDLSRVAKTLDRIEKATEDRKS